MTVTLRTAWPDSFAVDDHGVDETIGGIGVHVIDVAWLTEVAVGILSENGYRKVGEGVRKRPTMPFGTLRKTRVQYWTNEEPS